MSWNETANRLRIVLDRGAGLPEARELAKDMLRIAERRACQRTHEDRCASGCTAPVVVREPVALCHLCADMMLN